MKETCKHCIRGRIDGHYCAACLGFGVVVVIPPPKLTIVPDKDKKP